MPYDFNIERQNKTFNMELHEMFRLYNSVFEEPIFPEEMNNFFYTFADDEFFERPFFSRFELPAKRRIEILELCEEFNAKVAREFLGRNDGILFREPWPAPDGPWPSNEGLTTEKLVPILMQILLHQHRRIASLERIAAPVMALVDPRKATVSGKSSKRWLMWRRSLRRWLAAKLFRTSAVRK